MIPLTSNKEPVNPKVKLINGYISETGVRLHDMIKFDYTTTRIFNTYDQETVKILNLYINGSRQTVRTKSLKINIPKQLIPYI